MYRSSGPVCCVPREKSSPEIRDSKKPRSTSAGLILKIAANSSARPKEQRCNRYVEIHTRRSATKIPVNDPILGQSLGATDSSAEFIRTIKNMTMLRHPLAQ